MAAAVCRSILAVRSTGASRRLLSFTASKFLPLDGFGRPVSTARCAAAAGSHSIGAVNPTFIRFNTIRFKVNSSGSGYSRLNSGSNFSDRPPTEMARSSPDAITSTGSL